MDELEKKRSLILRHKNGTSVYLFIPLMHFVTIPPVSRAVFTARQSSAVSPCFGSYQISVELWGGLLDADWIWAGTRADSSRLTGPWTGLWLLVVGCPLRALNHINNNSNGCPLFRLFILIFWVAFVSSVRASIIIIILDEKIGA